MLGIDIIDLEDPLFKKRNERTLKFISNPEDSFRKEVHAFWYLWSAKEAVFKTKRELHPFAPKEIPITLEYETDGIYFKSGADIQGRIFRHDQVIIALASIKSCTLDEITFEHFRSNKEENASQQARKAIEESIAKNYGETVNVIHDGNGLPSLDMATIPVSISHHGNYIAYAYPKLH